MSSSGRPECIISTIGGSGAVASPKPDVCKCRCFAEEMSAPTDALKLVKLSLPASPKKDTVLVGNVDRQVRCVPPTSACFPFRLAREKVVAQQPSGVNLQTIPAAAVDVASQATASDSAFAASVSSSERIGSDAQVGSGVTSEVVGGFCDDHKDEVHGPAAVLAAAVAAVDVARHATASDSAFVAAGGSNSARTGSNAQLASGVTSEVVGGFCDDHKDKVHAVSPSPSSDGISLLGMLEMHGFSCIRSFTAEVCEKAQRLFFQHGWPLPEDGPTRQYISQLLGLTLDGKGDRRSLKRSTHLGLANIAGCCEDDVAAAAILSIYQYQDCRRCGCLEFIVSQVAGAGWALLTMAKGFLAARDINLLFSGADLSRPKALKAHKRWGFQQVSKKTWSQAGLAFYGRGDVCYMLLRLGLESRRARSRTPPANQLLR